MEQVVPKGVNLWWILVHLTIELGGLPLVEGGGAKHSPPGHGKTSLGTMGLMILRTSRSGSEDSGVQM